MSSLRLAVFSAATLLLAAPAFADPPAPTTDTTTAAPQPVQTPQRASRRRVHCEQEAPTGSFINHRTCYTEEEWADRRRAAEEAQRQANDRIAACNRGGAMTAC